MRLKEDLMHYQDLSNGAIISDGKKTVLLKAGTEVEIITRYKGGDCECKTKGGAFYIIPAAILA